MSIKNKFLNDVDNDYATSPREAVAFLREMLVDDKTIMSIDGLFAAIELLCDGYERDCYIQPVEGYQALCKLVPLETNSDPEMQLMAGMNNLVSRQNDSDAVKRAVRWLFEKYGTGE